MLRGIEVAMKFYNRAVFADGFTVSIQANSMVYCSPRSNGEASYSSVELGYPNRKCEIIADYAEDISNPDGTVYGYVPSFVVLNMIQAHGGLVNGEIPPLMPYRAEEEKEGE